MKDNRIPYEFITESDCPSCGLSLEYDSEEILAGRSVCPKCSATFNIRDSLNKKIFRSANLKEGRCSRCNALLIFTEEEKAKGVYVCEKCKEQSYIWEISSPVSEDSKEVIEKEIEEAIQKSNYDKAYALLNLRLIRIKKNLGKVTKLAKKRKIIGNTLGWTAAILTGGIGLEDFLIIPGANYAIQKVLGDNLNNVLGSFSDTVYRKVVVLASSEILITQEEFAYLINDVYLLMLLQNLRDIEVFLDQVSLYITNEPDVNNNQTNIEKIKEFFIGSKLKDIELMFYFWLSLGSITDEVYPESSFSSFIKGYYRSGQYSSEEALERSPEEVAKYEKILGVEWKGNNIEEIKKAYRRLVNIHHPDKVGGDINKFLEVQEAYIYFKQKGN